MKVIIFTHESDIDGIGSIILGKLSFDDMDYVLASNPEPLELKFREFINDKKLYNYDKIYITDLALLNPSLEIVSKDKKLKEKIMVFDHHEKAIKQGLNKYDFTFIEEVDKNGKKRCATEIFYNYLIDNNFINKSDIIDTYVELTRLEDTWEWKKNNREKAHDLAILFNEIGIEKYIDTIINVLKTKKSFKLDEEDLLIIKKQKEMYKKIIEKYVKEAEYYEDDNNNSFGIVIAPYQYRNDIPEYIRNNNDNGIKYFITVALDKEDYGQKSYRSIEKDFDVNEIAMKHNGGGHPAAAAVSITKEQNKKMKTMPKRLALEYISKCSYENI